MLAALAGGHAIDRLSPRAVIAVGAGVCVLAFAASAWEQHAWLALLGAFVLAGVGIGCAETPSRRWSPSRWRTGSEGTGTASSVWCSPCDLGASLVAGLIWALVSPTAAFGHVTAWMLAATGTAVAMRRHADPVAD